MAHPTRICAQRYRPKPEARIHLAQVTPEIYADPLFFIENMPDSDVEDRESGEHSEDEADSDDDIEEAVNAVCRTTRVHLIEIDELSPLEWDRSMFDKWTKDFRVVLNACTPQQLELCIDQNQGIPPILNPDNSG